MIKLRIIELLLIAAIPAILQVDRGHVHVGLILPTLFNGWIGATAVHTPNMVMDYSIDQKIRHTRRRPLAHNQASRWAAAVFSTVLMVTLVPWLWSLCNSLPVAVLILTTIAFYIFAYTLWLRHHTDQNVIWGGAVGCMPVMVSWAVITNSNPEITELAHWWQAFILFLLIFSWTPPHTWALGLRCKGGCKTAGVPMMPVVKPATVVSRCIIYYTAVTVITILLLVSYAGWIYLTDAVGTSTWFLWGTIDLHRHVKTGGKIKPMKLFFMSNNYLFIVCVALSLNAVLGLQTISSML